MRKPIPYTQEQLHDLFEEKEPGVLYYRTTGSGRKDISNPAGNRLRAGYHQIWIKCIRYQRHRLIWKMHTGQEPPEVVDHIKGIEVGDMFDNLQVSNCSHNLHKAKKRKTNTSGCTGVSWNKALKKWQASIYFNGKAKHLGYFIDKNDAHASYLSAKDLYHGGERALEEI